MANEHLREIEQNVAGIINRYFGDMFVQPSIRYFQIKGSKDQYFYTVGKINHNGKPRYVSGIMRYLKTKKQWKTLYEVGHAKKGAAVARAKKMFDEKR